MAKKYFKDMPSGDSQWTDAGHDVVYRFMVIANNFLKLNEEDGPVNLREFAYLLEYAVQGAITEECIRRRLGSNSRGRDFDDDSSKYYAPETDLVELKETIDDVWQWECQGLIGPDRSLWPSPTEVYCAYDTVVDPMKDGCIYCGEPYERK